MLFIYLFARQLNDKGYGTIIATNNFFIFQCAYSKVLILRFKV